MATMNLREIQNLVHETAKSKGWHDSDELDANGKPTARQILAWNDLVTDELDEAKLEDRAEYLEPDGKPCGYLTELVDARIRLLDMAGTCGYDMLDELANTDGGGPYAIETARNKFRDAVRKGDEKEKRRWMAEYLLAIDMMFDDKIATDATDDWSDDYVDDELDDDLDELERITLLKDAYNKTRPIRHGGKLA